MNFTFTQKLAMASGFIGAATSAFGALGPLMTSTQTLIGTVIFGFITACLGVVNTVTSSQAAQVKAVADMPGVAKITVNEQANQTLAQVATDPAQVKVAAAPEAAVIVQQTAKGT